MEMLQNNWLHERLPERGVNWVYAQLMKSKIVDGPDAIWRGVGSDDEPFDGEIRSNEHDIVEGLHGSCWTTNKNVCGHFGNKTLVSWVGAHRMLVLTEELFDVWAGMGGSGYGESEDWEKGDELGIKWENITHIGDIVMSFCFQHNIDLIQLYPHTSVHPFAENEIFVPFSPFANMPKNRFPFSFELVD